MQYYTKFNLTNYNSFHLNSVANEIWFPENTKELQGLITSLEQVPILSYGTNVLLAEKIDKIICLRSMSKNICSYSPGYYFVNCNTPLNVFIKKVIDNNYTGVEGLLGIPGSIGAAIVGNSGSGDYTISDFLTSVIAIDYYGNIHFFTKKDLIFKRRYCILQDKPYIITGAFFKFYEIGIEHNILNKTVEFRKNFPKGYNAGGIFKNWHVLKPYESEIRKIESKHIKISHMLNVPIYDGKGNVEDVLDFFDKITSIVKERLEFEIKFIGF